MFVAVLVCATMTEIAGWKSRKNEAKTLASEGFVGGSDQNAERIGVRAIRENGGGEYMTIYNTREPNEGGSNSHTENSSYSLVCATMTELTGWKSRGKIPGRKGFSQGF